MYRTIIITSKTLSYIGVQEDVPPQDRNYYTTLSRKKDIYITTRLLRYPTPYRCITQPYLEQFQL